MQREEVVQEGVVHKAAPVVVALKVRREQTTEEEERQ
jgi:hypothetical protein